MHLSLRRTARWSLLLFATILAACGGDSNGSGSAGPIGGDSPPPLVGDLQVKTLSNRADLISDGDAYLEVLLPANALSSDLKVDLNGTDVSASFAPRANGRILGVVSGLSEGANTVTAKLAKGGKSAKLQLTNHGRGGPLFAGAQLQPWVCATPVPKPVTVAVSGTGLSATVATHTSGLPGEPADDACNTATHYTYFYQPAGTSTTHCTSIVGSTPCFVKYDPAKRPDDAQIADFTNDRGATVKALLRLEEGVMNRGGYQLLAYFDPAKPWQPWAPQQGWNGKLLWRTGGGSGASQFQTTAAYGVFATQTSIGSDGIFQRDALARGYIIAAGQMTNNSENVNPFVSAEQIMMVKEHIVDTYGEIRFTMGEGVSGGSTQQNLVSSVMPGLLQGQLIGLSFPDTITSLIAPRDCSAIARYAATPAGAGLSPAQRLAVQGNGDCPAVDALQDPRVGSTCGGLLDRVGFTAIAYDPVTRPYGVRCSYFDALASNLGTVVDQDRNRKPKLPYDTVGVQYGLQALTGGVISAEQFVQLNEGIGGFDLDYNWSGAAALPAGSPAPRSRAVPDVLPLIYQTGLIANARNLAKVPIIDMRTDTGGDLHEPWRSLQLRARLDAVNGHHDNFVIRGMGKTASPQNFVGPALLSQSFDTMDRWLSAMEADSSTTSLEAKVVRHRPADARDGCYNSAGATAADVATEIPLSDSACPVSAALHFKSPQQVAGGPLSEDVLKCQLKTFNASSPDYGGVVFTAPQIVRLRAVFAEGVCDWTKPGVGQPTAASGMVSFASGPGGKAMSPAPGSVPF